MRPILLLLLFFSFTNCYKVERNCTDYKTGTFEFKYITDGIEKTGKLIRTETLSISYYEGKIDSSSVRWINDCEFILKTINPKSITEKDPLHMKILSTTENSYTFEYKLAVKKPNKPLHIEKGIAHKID